MQLQYHLLQLYNMFYVVNKCLHNFAVRKHFYRVYQCHCWVKGERLSSILVVERWALS